jgi:hypothetical protein
VNPRYFTIASGDTSGGAEQQVIYLTGSHFQNNFHDGVGLGPACANPPEQLDYGAYLAFLQEHGHNFIRLWRWEHFRSYLPGGVAHLCAMPQPWPRAGAGMATDGKPRFDLATFDESYFSRLRERVIAAGAAGIYVSVMLFDGFALHLSAPPDHVEGHPFHAGNNANGISITSMVDYQVLPLDPQVQALQEAYIRKVVDTVHDLPNVLYEVANEASGVTADSVTFPDGSSIPTAVGDSTQWQYWVIGFLRQYERQMGYDQHPVGMTMQYPVPDQRKVNDSLFNSPADWISPGFDEPISDESNSGAQPGGGPPPSQWLNDPPPNTGAKVVLTDTDHYSPFGSDALWAWKSFLRGHQPILYDLGIVGGLPPSNPAPEDGSGIPSYAYFEEARDAMGDTRRYAERMALVAMEPRGNLSSTGYALVNPGEEYLVLQPSATTDPFTVTLSAGSYAVEWHSVNRRETRTGDQITSVREEDARFTAPFAEAAPVVLYLKRVGL